MNRHLHAWHLLPDQVWQTQLDRTLQHSRHPKWSRAAFGQSLGMVFFNPSLRTRTSMELASAQLGGHSTVLVPGQGTWGFAWDNGVKMDGAEAEHIREAIGVLSNYYTALGVRLFASGTDYEADRDDHRMKQVIASSTVPVINLESAFYHPCQALADAATIATEFDGAYRKKKFVLSWTWHPKALPMAVPNSALLMAARMGMHVTVARPDDFELDPGIMEIAHQISRNAGGIVTETNQQDAACHGAKVIYAKAWGGRIRYQDAEKEKALRMQNKDWRITENRMNKTDEAIFMHCLPVRRGVVVDDAVLEDPRARHIIQAGFRLHAQKAILERVWGLHT